MSGDSNPNDPLTEKLVTYVSKGMLDEVDRRSILEGEEGESRGFVVRKALREYFRRHPEKKEGQA